VLSRSSESQPATAHASVTTAPRPDELCHPWNRLLPAPRGASRGDPSRRPALLRTREGRCHGADPQALNDHIAVQEVDDTGTPSPGASTSPMRNTTPNRRPRRRDQRYPRRNQAGPPGRQPAVAPFAESGPHTGVHRGREQQRHRDAVEATQDRMPYERSSRVAGPSRLSAVAGRPPARWPRALRSTMGGRPSRAESGPADASVPLFDPSGSLGKAS
jgi:hypothetical protein